MRFSAVFLRRQEVEGRDGRPARPGSKLDGAEADGRAARPYLFRFVSLFARPGLDRIIRPCHSVPDFLSSR
jgi:hypothetical protein